MSKYWKVRKVRIVLKISLLTSISSIHHFRTSIARSLHRQTGRRVVAFDARNHGLSEHTDSMSYEEMSNDIVDLLHRKLEVSSAILIGHSMGGRSCMYTALQRPGK